MKKLFKKWWFWVLVILLFAGIGANMENEEVASTNKEEENISDTNETNNEPTKKQQEVIDSLNNFSEFVDLYNELESDKTPTWQNYLYGQTVTWEGYVVRAGTSQLFVYGKDDYNGESWTELGDQEKLFYAFTAKYSDKNDFEGLQTGDKVTLEGTLESRGDKDLNYNWKIYNVKLK